MGRLIDADALLKELRKSCEYHAENSREFSLLQRDIIIVQEQPTIDAVPIEWILNNERMPKEGKGHDAIMDMIADWKDKAEPVRHGKWIGYAGTIGNECSVCGKWIDVLQGTAEMNYCPNCGARMDAE